jgi:UDP-N-acetylglucosamine 4,6-dehydratase
MSSYLITGGTGTFGNAMVDFLLKRNHGVDRIRVFSRDELKQSIMREKFNDQRLDFFIGDVRDAARLRLAMRGVDCVFHAAAMKQVPACEYNPSEAIRTNINGTENVAMACIEAGVKHMLLISSDKACAPLNIYGATKLAAEKLVCAASAYSGKNGTVFNAVRYGNVAGSRGSILPIWKERARKGESLLITDRRMTRFWMTIQDAVRFAFKVLHYGPGNSVCVPAQDEILAFNLEEAAKIILESRPRAHIPIIETGIRGGEKLHEFLVSQDEMPFAENIGGGMIRICSGVQSGIKESMSSETHPYRITGAELKQEIEKL